jgi:hypothetical protein
MMISQLDPEQQQQGSASLLREDLGAAGNHPLQPVACIEDTAQSSLPLPNYPTRLQIVLFHMRRGRSFGASTSPPCATLGQSRTRNRKSKFYIRVFRRLDSEPTNFDVRLVISPKPSDDTRATWDADRSWKRQHCRIAGSPGARFRRNRLWCLLFGAQPFQVHRLNSGLN